LPLAEPEQMLGGVTFGDVSELAQTLGGNFDIEVTQLKRGPFSGHLESWPLSGVVVSQGRLERSVQISGATNLEVTLLVTDPLCQGRMVLNGVTLEHRDALAAPYRTEHRFVLPEAFQGIVLQVSHPIWAEHTMPRQQFLPNADALCAFARSLAAMGRDLNDASRDALGNRCIELLLHSLPTATSHRVDSLNSRRKAAMMAADFIHHQPQAPLAVQTLCRQFHVGERTLREGFIEVFGLPPLEYVMAVRMNLVRRRLREADGGLTVAQAATEQGFWHLPRFSGFYRRFFGELPSQTLRQQAPKE
jgi:AraC-like DNA-binding protein